MAAKRLLKDKYFNVGRVHFTTTAAMLAAAETVAQQFETGISKTEKVAFLISSYKVHISCPAIAAAGGALNDALDEGDILRYGLSFVDLTNAGGAVLGWQPYDIGILDVNGIEHIGEGAPANFALQELQKVHSFREFGPEDGLIVHPYCLYAFVGTDAGIVAQLNFMFEIRYKMITLTDADYQEILTNQILVNMM